MTRHGPGPFVTEDPTLELADTHNQNNPWQARSASATSTG